MESTPVENSAVKVQNNVLMWLLLDVPQPAGEPVALKAVFFKASTDRGPALKRSSHTLTRTAEVFPTLGSSVTSLPSSRELIHHLQQN